MRELIEYSWDESTRIGTFTYELENGLTKIEEIYQPLPPAHLNADQYWGELMFYLRTQGEESESSSQAA